MKKQNKRGNKLILIIGIILGFFIASGAVVYIGSQTDVQKAEAALAGLTTEHTVTKTDEEEIGSGFYAGQMNDRDEKKRDNTQRKTEEVHKTPQQIKSQLNEFTDIAVSTATKKDDFVPAGVTLTMMVMGAEMGKQLSSQNLQKIITLLRNTKENASAADRKKYFQFASNSSKWFEGLQTNEYGGYDIGELLRIYDQYNLGKYDDKVRASISGTKATELEYTEIEPKTKAPKIKTGAMKSNATDKELRANQARAMNRWAEKEAKGTEAEVKFVGAKEPTESLSSNIRAKVRKAAIGESITFTDIDDYHTAVKEMMAFERGYSTWKKYEQEVGKERAKRDFNKRAEQGGPFSSKPLTVSRKIPSS